MKRILTPTALALALLCSCTPQDAPVAHTTPPAPAADSHTAAQTRAPEEKTPAPVILRRFYCDRYTYGIGGECAPDAVIRIEYGGEVSCESARGGLFFVALEAEDEPADCLISARADGMEESDPVTVRVEKSRTSDYVNFYVGRNSQLFLKSHIDDFTASNSFTGGEATYIVEKLSARAERIRAYSPDAVLIVAVVPNPQTIYPENAPDFLTEAKTRNKTRLAQLASAAHRQDDFIFVDLTDTLAAAKGRGELIMQTDTHWTECAAFAAYERIHEIISSFSPGIKTYTEDDFYKQTLDCAAGNYFEQKDSLVERATFYTPLFEYKNPLYDAVRPYSLQGAHIRGDYLCETGDSSLPVCVLVRDSFSTAIMKFLAEDFSLMYMQQMWQHTIDYESVERYRPDYVIHILSENNIGELLK